MVELYSLGHHLESFYNVKVLADDTNLHMSRDSNIDPTYIVRVGINRGIKLNVLWGSLYEPIQYGVWPEASTDNIQCTGATYEP